jgi:hypothetical protein
MALDEASLGAVNVKTLVLRDELIKRIEDACAEGVENMSFEQVISKQLRINPDYLIGLEDFTIPVLMICGLMHSVFQPDEHKVEKFQKKTAALFTNQTNGEFGMKAGLEACRNFMVVHAYDYASAFQGGVIARTIDKEGLAISYGGPMKSKRWITTLRMGDFEERFEEKLPEPYLAATALTIGVVNGVNSDIPIHVLGVGSPILVALIGYMLKSSKAVSIDSTAPFKDSNVGTLYGSKEAFLKMDMYKVAAYALIDDESFTSTTPFYRRFEKAFPSDWKGLRRELGVKKNSDLKELAATLRENQSLVEEKIPFFTKMRAGDDALIKQLRIDRAGHNYWILRNICVAVRSRQEDPDAIRKWMQYQVKRYKSVANRKWSKAIEEAFKLCQNHSK